MNDRALPSGIVTFVFADIEGSTRLIKRLGESYADVLDRHRALLQEAWDGFNGHLVGLEGDGSFVAFQNTEEAVRACAAGQRLIGSEHWPMEPPLKVRMGIHSGLAAPHNGDYVALAVHQAARVINAGYGGQVLISDDAMKSCATTSGLQFLDLGRFRLRDFDEPTRLFQLASDGLEISFPAVRALPAEGHNLVHPSTSFIGRETDVSLLVSKLAAQKAVTLVGPGGVGKTRLAMEVGLRVAPSWADGVWAVDLAVVDDSSLIEDAIGSALGVAPGGASRWKEILDYLAEKHLLIVLDNIEAHVDTCARLVRDVLRYCPNVGLLATGREALRISGEEVFHLLPLPIPPAEGGDDPEVQQWASVRLFLDRAHEARPDLPLESAAMGAVVGICRRMEGLPLAIEVAAARTAVLSPAEILAGLDDMFHLLRTNDRTLPKRQRSMQALLDWSHRLLSPAEQAAWRRLSIFGTGFSLEAAAAAVSGADIQADEVAEIVWSLVERSLAGTDLTANATRYRLLETVRQYGHRNLNAADEAGPVATRLAAWYLQRLGPWKAADRAWIGEAGLELDNLRVLIPHVAPFDQEAAQQIACLVGRYLDSVQSFATGIEELTRFARDLAAETSSRVALLAQLAHLQLRVGAVEPAREILARASELRLRVGCPDWDDVCVDRANGDVAMRSSNPEFAASIAETALAGSVSPRGRARMWNLLGLATSAMGDLDKGAAAFESELAEHRLAGHEAFVAGAAGNLAEIASRRGDDSTAAAYQSQCLESALALGQPVLVAYSLLLASRLAAGTGDWTTSALLAAKGSSMLSEAGQQLYPDDLSAFDALLVRTQQALGDTNFDRSVRDGAALDAAVAAEMASELFGQIAGRLATTLGSG